MFDNLRHFLAEFSATPAEREFQEDDYRLAAVALLVHLAEADGAADAAEKKRLKEIIERNFGLDDQATARLIAEARTAQDGANPAGTHSGLRSGPRPP